MTQGGPPAETRPRAGLILITIVLSGLACSGSPAPGTMSATPHYDDDTLEMKRQVVLSLIHDLSCTDDPACTSIAFGSKPCGGPWQYLAYSTATVDAERLADAVADYNAYQAGWNAQEGINSDCEYVMAPRTSCVDGKCVALPR